MTPSPQTPPPSSTLRARARPTNPTSTSPIPDSPESSDSDDDVSDTSTSNTAQALIASEDRAQISVLDILRVLGGVCLVLGLFSIFVTGSGGKGGIIGDGDGRWDAVTFGLWKRRPWYFRRERVKVWWSYPLLLPPSQLALYNGTDTRLPIYLALNSTIYDVSTSPHLYGPGGGYHFFAGRDATRAFVTGCFEDEAQLVGDLRGVEEMFLPVEEEGAGDSEDYKDDHGGRGEVDKKGEKREARRQKKLRRERERRRARKQVEETIRGWRKTYEENREGKYWPVGRVVWGEGSEAREQGEQPPGLCERARAGRPKREGKKEDEGASGA